MSLRLTFSDKVRRKIRTGREIPYSSDAGSQAYVQHSASPVPPSQDVELSPQTEQTTSSIPTAAFSPAQTIGTLPEQDGSSSNAQTHDHTATPPVTAPAISRAVGQTSASPSHTSHRADLPEQQVERRTRSFVPPPGLSASALPVNLASLWKDALGGYTKQTGTDLDADPLTIRLSGHKSVEDIMAIVEEHTQAFNEFRAGGAKAQLLQTLNPIVTAVLALEPSETLGGGVGVVKNSSVTSKRQSLTTIGQIFHPAKATVGAIVALLKATKDVSWSYDSLVDLLSCISKFLDSLSVYMRMSLTMPMKEIFIKTLANVISILALATKEVDQGRLKNYVRTLLGDTHVEDALKQLARMGAAETQMIGVESLWLTYSLTVDLNELMHGKEGSMEHIREALESFRSSTAMKKIKYDGGVQKHQDWLAPPDPSINHNLALRFYSERTCAWFIDGQVMGEWRTTSSLLWIHGIPGSGKTILCTAIIENIRWLCLIQQKSILAYFYCDFQDAMKQSARGLLSHVLIRFSAESNDCSKLLSDLWSLHRSGSQQPSEHELRQCLKRMIELLADHCIYIIIDALDECPNSSVNSQRGGVLAFIREIVEWRFQNVHICVTSRHEQDIKEAMEALSPRSISLHTESGQTDEISSYLDSVMDSDPALQEPEMLWIAVKRKQISEEANGMFRWVFWRLQSWRPHLLAAIHSDLNELPETLDDTYRRILKSLDTPDWEYTHRLFECLAVCARPLRVEELADVLAVDFDTGPIPRFSTDRRPLDPKGNILSSCSSMIVIDSQTETVQFAHLSVKEYLVSECLASDVEGNVKRFHIVKEHAHTTLAKVCLAIMLQLDNTSISNHSATCHVAPVSPLSAYAAEHFIGHAKVTNVETDIQEAMEWAFDPRKPHYEAWSYLHNSAVGEWNHSKHLPQRSPLYCVALHSFYKTTEYLLATCAYAVDTVDGFYGTALQATSYRGHLEVVRLLIEHDADVRTEGGYYGTALQAASCRGHLEIVRLLIEHGADVRTEGGHYGTALQAASYGEHLEIVRLLIEHGADVRTEGGLYGTALQAASYREHLEIVRLLIEHGADVRTEGGRYGTALQAASTFGYLEIMRLLIEHGADVRTESGHYGTVLQAASDGGHLEVVRPLIKHSAITAAIPTSPSLQTSHPNGSQKSPSHDRFDVHNQEAYPTTSVIPVSGRETPVDNWKTKSSNDDPHKAIHGAHTTRSESSNDEEARLLSSMKDLKGMEAQMAIESLDKELEQIRPQDGSAPSRDFRLRLKLLRRLCMKNEIYPEALVLPPQSVQILGEQAEEFGGSSRVYRGRYGECHVALKVIATTRELHHMEPNTTVKRFHGEAIIWRHLRHPNITTFYGVDNSLFGLGLISEWMTLGTISQFLSRNPRNNRIKLLQDVANGLAYLHTLDIVHADMKSANILVNNEHIACLIDFGIATLSTDAAVAFTSTISTTGTTRWTAPEILNPELVKRSTSKFTSECDIYSLSMTMWEVFTGRLPFHEYDNDGTVIFKTLSQKRPNCPPPPAALSVGLVDTIWALMENCWDHDSSRRPDINHVLSILSSEDSRSENCPSTWPLELP